MIYSCEEHFERALDDFILQHEVAPDIMFVDKGQKCAHVDNLICHYCDKEANYWFRKPEPEILEPEEKDL